MLSSGGGQANFRGLEAKAKDLTFEAKNFKMCPRGHPRGQGRPRGLNLWWQLHQCARYTFGEANGGSAEYSYLR